MLPPFGPQVWPHFAVYMICILLKRHEVVNRWTFSAPLQDHHILLTGPPHPPEWRFSILTVLFNAHYGVPTTHTPNLVRKKLTSHHCVQKHKRCHKAFQPGKHLHIQLYIILIARLVCCFSQLMYETLHEKMIQSQSLGRGTILDQWTTHTSPHWYS